MEYQSFENSEEELLYFVRSFYNETWRWSDQYGADLTHDSTDEEHRKFKLYLNLLIFFFHAHSIFFISKL